MPTHFWDHLGITKVNLIRRLYIGSRVEKDLSFVYMPL